MNGGNDVFKALEYIKCENLFAKALHNVVSNEDKKKRTSKKNPIQKQVEQFRKLKSSGAFQIELDNSRTTVFPGCYINCIVQALWHVFDDKQWTLFLQTCVDIADKYNHIRDKYSHIADEYSHIRDKYCDIRC